MRAKTQFIQDHSHLCIELKSILASPIRQKVPIHEPPNDDAQLQTNFGIKVNNPYCFVLLHLRNRTTKSPINIRIPEVCIFHDRVPYDVVHMSKGHVRGYRTPEHTKIRLKEVYKIFKDSWVHHNLPKTEQPVAAFLDQQVLMLSDNDLFLASYKPKQDPFFKKLQFLRNKLPHNTNMPITAPYSDSEQQHSVLKLATESLLSYRTEEETCELLGKGQEGMEEGEWERRYLGFLNEKIVLFMNYQHNIRVKKANFVYTKTNDGHYFLVNVHRLQFTNLTGAILQREKRLAQREQQRNKILIMSASKQLRYRKYQPNPNIKTYQSIMHTQFNSIVSHLQLNKVSDNKLQQVKNQLAFKKLHPKSRFTYPEVIGSGNFVRVKDEVLGNLARKPISIPSRYVMRFYNKVRDGRVKTEVVDVMDF